MNKEELQTKLNNLLIGFNTFSMPMLSNFVKEKLYEWFDNSQEYYSTRYSGFAITITYKERKVVEFKLKRKQVNNEHIVDKVIIEEDFTDTETRIELIKNKLVEELKDDWRFAYCKVKKSNLKDCLQLVRRYFGDMKASEIKSMLYCLSQDFWNFEEQLCKEKNDE